MDLTYTFNILVMSKKTVNSIDSVVLDILWEKKGYDASGNFATFKTRSELDTSNVGISSSFKPFDSLTKADIFNWINSIHDQDSANQYIQEKLQEKYDGYQILQPGQFPWD